MREYIFDFDQKTMMDLDLSTEEALLLDYLVKFSDSGYAITRNIGGRKYCWITYKKLLSDLPVLRKRERQTRRILAGLEKKGLIKRYVENKNRLFIYVDQEILFYGYDGSPCLSHDNLTDLYSLPLGQNVPPIVRYYKNKIKILTRNARVKDLDKNEFLLKLKQKMKTQISEYAFDAHFNNAGVDSISDKLILLSVPAASELKNRPNNPFEAVVKETIDELVAQL